MPEPVAPETRRFARVATSARTTGTSGGASVPDQVWQTDSVVAVAEKCETFESLDSLGQFGHAVEVTNAVLREAAGPASDYCYLWLGQWAEDAG